MPHLHPNQDAVGSPNRCPLMILLATTNKRQRFQRTQHEVLVYTFHGHPAKFDRLAKRPNIEVNTHIHK